MEVGRYRVVKRIGKGGMAEVFEAVAVGPDGFERRVAVKRLLDAHAGDAAFGRMFLDEARIASQLHHAHIVAVHDYGVEGGHPFQVLEFIDGADLGALLELGPLPVELALHICMDVAHALEHAHLAVGPDGQPLGIVHRDVSPANILVAWSGDVKLSDFGIAFARGRLEETAAGLAKGTLLYMAPEQLMRGALDGRTDLFSLGCVLHRLVGGQSPLAGEVAMADLVAGAPLRLSPTLPDDVRIIVARATQLVRTERYPDAAAMAQALGQALLRRIDTDPRTLLRAWLSKAKRDEKPAQTAGRLDALLGVGPIFSGMRATERARPTRNDGGDGSSVVPARRRFYWARALAAAAPIVAGLLALLFWPRDGAPVVAAVPDAPRAAVAVVVTTPDAPVLAVTYRPDAPVVPAPPVEHVRSHARPPRIEPAEAPTDTGVVAIGGDRGVGAQIEIDGRAFGQGPKRVTLPVGEHEIVLRCKDGQRLTRTVRVEPSHTESAPLRWTVE